MNLTSWRTILRSCALLALAPLFICAQEVTSPQVNGSTHARLINSLAVNRMIYKVKPPGGHGPVPGCPKCQPPGWSIQKDLVKVRESGLSALKVKPEDVNAALSLAERLSRDLDSSVIDDAERVNLLAINLIVAGKKPEGVSDQNWNKEQALASCLQNLGYIAALRNQIDKEDAGIEGLVWHDLRATYGTRLGEAGFNAYDIAKLMGHANISTSQRYVRNLPVGAGEAVMLKNQRRHSNTGPTLSGRVRAL